jgi:hypothetical protein
MMHKFDTTDIKQVRRFRYTQFNGRSATFRLSEMTIKGFVQSVFEHKSAVPARWTVTIVPEADAVTRDVYK